MKTIAMNTAPWLLLAAASLMSSAAQATEPAKAVPLETVLATCASCHGAKGDAPVAGTGAPILAGQYADYLRTAMQAYKSGERKNPIMAGQVAQLSKQQIADLAQFFSKQAGPLHVKTFKDNQTK